MGIFFWGLTKNTKGYWSSFLPGTDVSENTLLCPTFSPPFRQLGDSFHQDDLTFQTQQRDATCNDNSTIIHKCAHNTHSPNTHKPVPKLDIPTLELAQVPLQIGPRLKVLLFGSGSREHSLAWKLSHSPLVELFTSCPATLGPLLRQDHQHHPNPASSLCNTGQLRGLNARQARYPQPGDYS